MKWKDSGEMIEKEDGSEEEYFDEEQYSPWAEKKDNKKGFKLGKVQVLFILLTSAIVALVVALLVLLINGGNAMNSPQQLANIEKRLQKLEERVDKYEGIDEKVTAIWEQAKSFEKFKDRFERSEASTSLRMDHLTMSLESLQKQINESRAASKAKGPGNRVAGKSSVKTQYYQVKPGDTFYSISKQYDLKVDELLKMNQLEPDSVIVPGQKLIVRRSAD